MNSITQNLRSKLFAGLATLLPLYLTFIVVKFLFVSLEETSRPILKNFGANIPGLGIILTIILIYILGVLVTNFLGKKILVLINPKIKVMNKNSTFDSYEGCLSVPNIRGIVKRFTEIKVEYYDENKNFVSKNISGFPAIVYQHEIDHLDGILFTDKVFDNETLVSNLNYVKYYEKKYLQDIKKRFANQ